MTIEYSKAVSTPNYLKQIEKASNDWRPSQPLQKFERTPEFMSSAEAIRLGYIQNENGQRVERSPEEYKRWKQK
jgi:hypothetical protein